MLLSKRQFIPQPLLSYFKTLPAPIKGIALALASNALFVTVGALVRVLSESIDVFQILFFRQLVFVILLLPSILVNLDVLMKPKMVKLHLLRVAGAFVALYFGYLTVSNIPFADATAIGFTKVIFVAIISRLFLTESVGLSRFVMVAVGFVGVMLVVQPSMSQASEGYILIGLIGALGAAVAVICVRKMAATEPRVAVLTYQAISVGIIALIPSLLSWQWPTMYEFTLLILVGVISSIAQWLGVTAYKWGEANIIANVEYSQMIYSLALGYWLFTEIPNSLAIVGVSIIVASALIPYALKYWEKQIR
ncbi:DMT family transporter [Photobacterium profundum]|uniref:DMT family transporter n=1 Tax=Photobacterium profundum TaxID=74109 RepID=UPI003D0B4358